MGDEDELLSAAASGSEEARDRLLAGYRERLKRIIRARLSPRLSARIDPSDVVQEVLADVDRGLDAYLSARPTEFYPWVRGIVERRVIDLHRRHLDAAKRSVRRESLPPTTESGSATVGEGWPADSQSSPSQRLVRAEELVTLRAGLELLSDDDREVINLRYFEELAMPEVAEVLNIGLPAAKSRHLRAIARLTALVNQNVQDSD